MPYEKKPQMGRPRLSEEKVNDVRGFAERGAPPAEAIQHTGVGKTKVYEIYSAVQAEAGKD